MMSSYDDAIFEDDFNKDRPGAQPPMPKTELRADEPRKDCPFCGCLGKDLDSDQIHIIHECCGLVEWNEWNERPLEDALRRRVDALEKTVGAIRGSMQLADDGIPSCDIILAVKLHIKELTEDGGG